MTGIYRIMTGFGKVAMAETYKKINQLYESFPLSFRKELKIEVKVSDEGEGKWEEVKI